MGLTTSSSSALLLKSPTGLNRNLIRAGTRRFSSPLHSSAQSPELLKENNFLCWKEGDVTLPCFQCQTPRSEPSAHPQPRSLLPSTRRSRRARPHVPAQGARRCCCSCWHHTAPRATFFFFDARICSICCLDT